MGLILITPFMAKNNFKALKTDRMKLQIFRALINLLPAFIFLFNKDKFSKNDTEKGIFTILSLLAILNFFICFVASTFSDRIGYYLIILQLYVFSNIFVVF